MKRTTIILILCMCFAVLADGYAQRSRSKGRRSKARTHARAVPRRAKGRSARVRVAPRPVAPPTIHDENPYLQCEDTCGHVHGIDLSHYQGQVFWETVGQHTKMTYVYLKATEGSDNIDSFFERNIDLAHRYGLKVGCYHFFRPKVDVRVQVENFKRQCLPGEQDLIPMMDIETDGGLRTDVFCDSLQKFLDLIEEAYRQKPLIYTYRNFYNKHLVDRLSADYPLMIAMYANDEPVLADGRDITMWQYSCKGRINGVSGYVDKSRFMGRHTLRDIWYRR